jgi:Ca2+-binding RTX toxin-like protein
MVLASGGSGNDILTGTPQDDHLSGNNGHDRLIGLDGNDQLFGGNGRDELLGGAGNDFMRGGAGRDSYDGGDNDGESEFGGYGDAVSFYEFAATQGVIADLRTGIIANDGFGNAETMTGIESLGGGTAYADIFDGSDGINHLAGGSGDTIRGHGGNDVFHLDGATALLDGGDGIDMLAGIDPAKLVIGSGGIAQVARTENGVRIDLSAGTFVDGFGTEGTIVNVENIAGTSGGFNDVLLGDALSNEIRSLGGNDTLTGRGGDDIIWSNDGSSRVSGGAGNDTVVAGDIATEVGHYHIPEGLGGVEINLAGGFIDETNLQTGTVAANTASVDRDTLTGIENMVGTGFGDRLIGDAGANVIAAGAGNDFVHGGGGVDTIDYSDARGCITLDLGAGTATMAGSGAPNKSIYVPDEETGAPVELVLVADDKYSSTDRLISIENAVGSSLRDVLVGSDAANRLDGGDGADRLNGGGGEDRLIGGEGRDAFLFDSALDGGLDTILDFAAADDTMRLDRTVFDAIAADGALALSAFREGTEAADANDRIIYDQASGRIWYDADGSGAGEQVLFAEVTDGTELSRLDFVAYTGG